MKIIFFLLCIILFHCFLITAKIKDTVKNNVYFELGGNGYLYSLNYERTIDENYNIRMGFSILPKGSLSSEPNRDLIFSPLLMLNYLMRFNKEINNGLDFGIGIIYVRAGEISPALSIGYRYCPVDGGTIFQIALTPILGIYFRSFIKPPKYI